MYQVGDSVMSRCDGPESKSAGPAHLPSCAELRDDSLLKGFRDGTESRTERRLALFQGRGAWKVPACKVTLAYDA